MEEVVRGVVAMDEFAERFARELAPRGGGALVVGLSGELGSGKTTFAKGVARVLGVAETVTSPTFVIEKIYGLEGERFERLVHVDAYRLDGAEELRALGFGELCADRGNLILVEWPERVRGALPDDAVAFHFSIVNGGAARLIHYGENPENG